ncbi:MAG: hypothetical protein HQL36_01710 [Alphaproteobacteria bacterium]|nr:hypothetical protein [Alphaproteobacteria bacterium]MBF0251307.1 hypothetical protein [Alphaproteobacteria bacterium]
MTRTDTAERVLRTELEKTANLISGARRLMAEGRHVDLTALAERMRAIDEAVRAAPAEVARNYAEHLDALMAALNSLEADLDAQHAALKTHYGPLKHREAVEAYDPKRKA